jgi:hypothetical protein
VLDRGTINEMTRLLIPTSGPSDWRRLLADPGRQWVKGRSALELAVSWEAARRTTRGIPSSVSRVLDSHAQFAGASLLIGIPEHQVQFDGGGHASQTDLWALLRAPVGIVSMSVEAKAGEGFDRTIASWLADAKPTSGKPARLAQLKSMLGIATELPETVRYQLLHRTASAIHEAERFGARNALLLVQSFSSDPESAAAYAAFCAILGCTNHAGNLVEGPQLGAIRLHFAWVDCEPCGVDQLAAAV